MPAKQEESVATEIDVDVPEAAPPEEPKGISVQRIPLFGKPGEPVWALLNLIMCIISALIAVFVLIKSGKRKDEEEEDEYDAAYADDSKAREKTRRPVCQTLAVIFGIMGVIVFLLTEDMRNTMVLIDFWTIVNAIILILAVTCAGFIFKRKRADEKDSV